MASTTALYTGLSGMTAHARQLDVIGNNISNASTTAYRGSRLMFQNMFSNDVRAGSAPADPAGGTNPYQVGLGVSVAGTQRNMQPGSVNPTGDSRDLAIDGNGFFVIDQGGDTLFTRDGSFRTDLSNTLVTIGGDRVMGYPVDDNFNLQTGRLQPIEIPIGQLTLAEATTQSVVAGNLNATGPLPGQGTLLTLGSAVGVGFSLIGGGFANAASPLTSIESPLAVGSPMFTAGQSILMTGAEKGDKVLRDASFDVSAASTVQDFLDFLNAALGLHTGLGTNPDGRTPGVSIDANGVISVDGNTGTTNNIELSADALRLVNPDGTLESLPFVPERVNDADGEAVRTTMVVYDSLGTPLNVDVSLVLDSRSNAGTTWRYFVDSGDDSDLTPAVTTGTISFGPDGQLISADPVTVALTRDGSGALTPLTFTLSFQSDAGRMTALTDTPSEVAAVFRDGLPTGTLTGYGTSPNGTIVGTFSNGSTRTLGQVALATFTNDAGLMDGGGNLWRVGPNSGAPIIGSPGVMGAGNIVSGALELSNVDLGQEFINLITVQTGYSASTRVIRTTDELMQQLLVLGR